MLEHRIGVRPDGHGHIRAECACGWKGNEHPFGTGKNASGAEAVVEAHDHLDDQVASQGR